MPELRLVARMAVTAATESRRASSRSTASRRSHAGHRGSRNTRGRGPHSQDAAKRPSAGCADGGGGGSARQPCIGWAAGQLDGWCANRPRRRRTSGQTAAGRFAASLKRAARGRQEPMSRGGPAMQRRDVRSMHAMRPTWRSRQSGGRGVAWANRADLRAPSIHAVSKNAAGAPYRGRWCHVYYANAR